LLITGGSKFNDSGLLDISTSKWAGGAGAERAKEGSRSIPFFPTFGP
jgi:hypothetical protein